MVLFPSLRVDVVVVVVGGGGGGGDDDQVLTQQTVFCLLVLESLSSCKFSHVMLLIYWTYICICLERSYFVLQAMLGYQSVA